MATGLYVPIRGDYSEFQKDIKRLQGIARQSAEELSNIFGNAFSKGDASRGLSQIAMALKKLGTAASTVGTQFKPAITEINEFAHKCGVSANQVERLVTQMGYAARERQMLSSLRTLQRQAGLTDSALAQLARHRNLFAESGSIASESLGVRTAAKIKADIREAEAAFKQFQMTANLTGESTQRQFEAMTAKVRQFSMELMNASQREAFLQRERYDRLASQVSPRGATDAGFARYQSRNAARDAVGAFQELNGRLPRPAEIRQIAQATGQSAAQIRRMRDELDHSSNAFKALIGYAQVWVTFGFVHTAQQFVKTAMALDNVKVAFTAIYGTADMAEKKLEYVRQVSDQLGLSFLETAEGAKKLFAAANGTPVEQHANMVFKSFSDMSAALKLTGDETKGVFLALSQMISKGKVSAEELRQQLAERMPGAVNLFAKSIGVTTQELDKMLQKGQVTLEHFVKFSAEVGKTYFAGAQMASHSLQAELNRLSNSWVEFQAKTTNTDSLAVGVRQLNSMLKGTLEIIATLAPHAEDLFKTSFGLWLASSLAPAGRLNTILVGLAASTKACWKAIVEFGVATKAAVLGAGSLSAALKALGSAMMTVAKNPAFLALVATAGVVVHALMSDSEKAKKAFDDVGDSMDEMVKKRLALEEASKNSAFSPDFKRQSLAEDTNKMFDDWEDRMNNFQAEMRARQAAVQASAMNEFDPTFGAAALNSEGKVAEGYKTAIEMLRQWEAEARKAATSNDLETIDKTQTAIITGWRELKSRLKEEFKMSDADVKNVGDAAAKLLTTVSSAYANTSQILDTYSRESIAVAKELGLNLDALKKSYDKLAKAAQNTALGKSFADFEGFKKISEYLGQADVAFDSTTAAAGKFMDTIVNSTTGVGEAYNKYSALHAEVAELGDKWAHGLPVADQFNAALGRSEEAAKLLTEQKKELTMAIFNASAAAGGSPAAFNAMISVFEQAAQAAGWTAQQISEIVGQLQAVQAQAVETMNAARSAAVISGAENALLGTEIKSAYDKGDFESWYSLQTYKDSGSGKGVGSRDAYQRAWNLNKENDRRMKALRDAHKKGGGKKGGGGKRVDNTEEKWHSAEEGWRKKIADMQGQKDVQTLAKDFADMDKQLKGSSVDMKALKKDYLEAFSGKYANDLNKELLHLRGNEAELAKIDIEEKYKAKAAAIEGMAEEAKKLGITVEDYTPKLAEYRKLLEGQAREQQLQKELPYYEKFSWFDGMKNEALAKQNELIAIQAEKMKGTIPDELIDRWRQIEELQNRVKNGNDVLAGISLGAKKYAMEMGNFAENVSDLVNKSFGDMADAFADFVMTGKISFTDLANSIIKDLMRIAIQQAIVGPIANGIGNLFGGLFGGGASSAVSGVAGKIGGVASGIAAGAGFVGGSALGNVFTGLQGFSNQIVSRPTLFSYGSQLTRFAKGGVMGEAGPEAVMPLTRTASGHLGVRSDGSNAPIVNVVINNSTGQRATQQTKTDNQGNKSIEVMVGDMAAQQMLKTGSSLNRAVRTFSGQSQQVTRR